MDISVQGSSSIAYSSMTSRSVQSRVTLSGTTGDIATAASAKKSDHPANLTGKLNALEHSASASTNPMFLRGVIQKVADVKARNLSVDQLSFTQSSFESSSTGLGIQDDGAAQTYSAEQLRVAGQDTSYQAQGTFRTKSGAELGFNVELNSSKIAATYAAASYQTTTAANSNPVQALPSEPEQTSALDAAA